jgi:hypothetical protein
VFEAFVVVVGPLVRANGDSDGWEIVSVLKSIRAPKSWHTLLAPDKDSNNALTVLAMLLSWTESLTNVGVEIVERWTIVVAVVFAVDPYVRRGPGTTLSSPLGAVRPFRIGKNRTEQHLFYSLSDDCRYPKPKLWMMQHVVVLDARHL